MQPDLGRLRFCEHDRVWADHYNPHHDGATSAEYGVTLGFGLMK
jgi:hypothetical protein